jgi:hypothetical protein
MKFLKFTVALAGGSILAALLLWISLAVGAAQPERYLALARASCLLCGSLGLLASTLLSRPKMTLCALLLLAAGLASFWYRAN